MKAKGVLPKDAYCSTGELYVQEVDWRNGGTTSVQNTGLWSEFDARPMTQTEKRFLQAALAMKGYYSGLADGIWGNGSQHALERYTAAEFEGEKPYNAHAAYLATEVIGTWLDEGWEYQHIEYLNFSMMLPVDSLRLEDEDGTFQEWHHSTKDLQLMFNDLDTVGMVRVHQGLVEAPGLTAEPYALRRDNTWVSSGQLSTGTLYVRSDLIGGTWSTVYVSAGRSLQGEVGLIASSIRPGRPASIFPEEDGVLLSFVAELVAMLEGETAPSNQTPDTGVARSGTPPGSDNQDVGGSTGTAFFVTDEGVAITNAHVVDGCTALKLGGEPAETIVVSSAFDLAAIRLQEPQQTVPLKFSGQDAGLNADITIAGYPLHGLLGGLNVSRGSVSSLKGIQGDEKSIQISAPVQPGNSGGPAIDKQGGVVGVVVSKLDTVALADATGDIAQNINFAIRGSLAKVFLASNGIIYSETEGSDLVSPEKAADLLQASTRLVECSR